MKPTTRDDYRQRIETVLRHVCDHLDEPLRPDDLARIACFSPHHFHRIFRGMVGESLAGFVRRMRLERAALRLRGTRDTVLEVALDSGYTAHEPFTRAFKRAFGESPAAFRDRAPSPFPMTPNGIHFGGALPPLPYDLPVGDPTMLDVDLRTLDPFHLAAIRHVGPYTGVGPVFERVVGWAAMRGLLGPDTLTVGIFHDDPQAVPEKELRSDAGIQVKGDVSPDPEAGVDIVEVPGGEYAVATLKGSYEQLPQAYGWLVGQWLPSSGREADDRPCFEVYRNSPADTAPEELLTEIHLPLK